MLVLSRKEDQRILFPNLGIAVEVRRIEGKTVKLGIEAPPEVRVLREELAPREEPAQDTCREDSSMRRHALRNRLNTVSLALHLARKRLAAGQIEEVQRPLNRALAELAELEISRGSAPREARPAFGGAWRALLVEDNPHERELLAGYLQVSGYQVDAVEDGEAALGYLRRESRPDVVLLDMQMPRLDGRETVSAIRSDPAFCGLKIVAVSGAEHLKSRVPLGAKGVDRWFSKPLQPRDFVRELDAELAGSEQTACSPP